MEANITLDLQLQFKEAKELVRHCIENLEPIMLWGPPGIGKSDLVRELGKEMGREVIDIRASLLTEVDVKGYPYLDDESKTMKFALSNEFPQDPDSNAIVFLDELPAGLPSTQLALYQYILDRKIGQYTSPKNVAIIAAGNREQDRAGTFQMPKPLENRFVHVEVIHSFNQWLEWAIKNTVNKDIVSYLSKNKEKLHMFDPDSQTRAFPTPRSWHKASKLLNAKNLPNEQVVHVVAGCVGNGIASDFIAFKDIIDKLPDPMDVLSGKVTKMEKVEAPICYAIVTNLLYKLREVLPNDRLQTDGIYQFKDAKLEEEWHTYANNFFNFLMNNDKVIGPEFTAMAAQAGFNTYKLPFNARKTTAMMKAVSKYKLILEGIE